MPYKKPDGRQRPTVAIAVVALADLSSPLAALDIPPQAIVTDIKVFVDTAFDAATTATLKIGDAVDDDRYTGTPLDIKTTGLKSGAATGFLTTGAPLLLTYGSSGAAASNGKLRLVVEYIVNGRSDFTHG